MNTDRRFKRAFARGFNNLKRHPNQIVRLSIGVLLILGGLLWFLPVLGLWMLPLGLAILFANSPIYWRLRRRFVGWRRKRKLAKRQHRSGSE